MRRRPRPPRGLDCSRRKKLILLLRSIVQEFRGRGRGEDLMQDKVYQNTYQSSLYQSILIYYCITRIFCW